MLSNLLFKSRIASRPYLASGALRYFGATPAKVGDKFPQAVVAVVRFEPDEGFTNEIVDINEYFENKNVILVGYPGAFTPTC